jgi:polysaccharide export outer membrane protein
MRCLLKTMMLIALVLAGCAKNPAPNLGQTDTHPVATAESQTSDYIIGPGDTLNINVYQVPELSMSVPVRPDGRVSIPLVPDMPASGKTSSQLAKDIQEKLKDYIKDAHVTIILTNFVGPFDRQVRVIGEATQPLALPYRDHMTLLDVMIEAKGLTRFAAGNSAEIIRRTGNTTQTIPVRLSDLIRDGDISKNVAMQPGDTLIIPQTWF